MCARDLFQESISVVGDGHVFLNAPQIFAYGDDREEQHGLERYICHAGGLLCYMSRMSVIPRFPRYFILEIRFEPHTGRAMHRHHTCRGSGIHLRRVTTRPVVHISKLPVHHSQPHLFQDVRSCIPALLTKLACHSQRVM